jgi:hypothetical protein
MAAPSDHPLLFKPDGFFIKPWRGWGVVMAPTGKTLARFSAFGDGRAESRSAVVFQNLTFEDGRTHRVEWEIVSDDEGRYVATETTTAVVARGLVSGGNFCWSFKAPGPTPVGVRRCSTRVRYTLVTPEKALSFAETRWLGLPLARITTFYERREA